MQGVGDDLLSRPALPIEQNRCIAGGDHGKGFKEVLHGFALSDDPGEIESIGEPFPEDNVFLSQTIMIQGLVDQNLQFLYVQGLCEVIIGA